jgi:putative spermidine/putrescine transport system substrate-binding protein
MLQDMAAGTPNLEFALIADGVPMDKVYPIDIDRAFISMSRIKPYIKKFWDTGALSAQILADRDVVLCSIWNGRLQAIADQGAPVAIDWTQHMLSIQAYGIFKDAKNLKNAQLYVDYAMQGKAQVGMPKELNYGPTNIKAFDMLTAAQKANLPGSPENMKRCFIQDVNWWSDNRAKVNATWSNWILT